MSTDLAGPRNPLVVTPPRLPRSIRRTTSIEMFFPDGLAADVRHRGIGRDLLTRADGSAETLETVSFDARIAFGQGQRITAIATDPAVEGSQSLLGTAAGGGYRKHLNQLARDGALSSLHYQLLDDLAGASLVSGYAPQLAIAEGDEGAGRGRQAMSPEAEKIMKGMTDLCAGWQEGGTILKSVYSVGHPPMLRGPEAPEYAAPDDPMGWHVIDTDMAPRGMRRIRRIDVTAGTEAESPLQVNTWFRDTYMDAVGYVTIVHEYELAAQVEPRTLGIKSIEANPRVLPYRECPQAAASALRIAGTTTDDLRARTRAEFTGASTCTHLNDVLRSLEDVGALAAHLDVELTP